jgi:CBS domain-containing protein
MVITIRQVLQHKGPKVWSIDPEATVFEALELLSAKGIGALVVLHNDRVVGILSERDYTRKVVLHGLVAQETTVRQIMTSLICYVSPNNTIEEGLALITDKHCRHLPVLEDGKLVGLVSIGDLVKASLDEKEFKISQLEGYIQGG